jgi:hypothetical protein
VLTMMGPAVPQLDVTTAAACSFPVVSTVWYGPLDPEVELVVVWKEDMVNWLVIGIRCEESGFVESNAEVRTTTLFNRAWAPSTSEGSLARVDVHRSRHNYVLFALSLDNAVPGQAFCGRIASWSHTKYLPEIS